MPKPKAWLSWSSGKDSAWALHVARQQGEYEITRLLTTVNSGYRRVAMHAVREELLEAQVQAIVRGQSPSSKPTELSGEPPLSSPVAPAAGLPLVKVPIPQQCSNENYEAAMAKAMQQAQAEGVRHVLFGDLFLEDVRQYREEKLKAVEMQAVFPLWLRDTRELAEEMVASGLRARLTCVDPKQLDPAFAGRTFDAQLLADLPKEVDPCGERGEFHSFCYAGPMFSSPLSVHPGEVVEREGFIFADLLPVPPIP